MRFSRSVDIPTSSALPIGTDPAASGKPARTMTMTGSQALSSACICGLPEMNALDRDFFVGLFRRGGSSDPPSASHEQQRKATPSRGDVRRLEKHDDAYRGEPRLQIIGVIDLLGGLAVHARAGARDRYAPVQNAAGWPIDPGNARTLAEIYTEVLGISQIYAADLDGILHQ